MKLSDIAVDIKAMENGVWVSCRGGWEALVRSANNKDAKNLADQHMKKNRPIFRHGDFPGWETRDVQNLEIIVETCLLNWRYVDEFDDEGELSAVPFSKEKAYEVLGDPAYIKMYEDVTDAAGMAETFEKSAREADGKN